VASGRVMRGTLKRDTEVEIVGGGDQTIRTKVTDIETFNKSCGESRAGDNSALLLRGVKREDIRRGMVVAVPSTVKAIQEVLVSMYVLTEEEGGRKTGFTQAYRPQLFVRTADEAASLQWPETEEDPSRMILPGDNIEIILKTHHKCVMEPGERFNLREGGRTVATGLVTRIIK